MKQWKFRRVISFLLALVLVLGAMPVGVFAQDNPEGQIAAEEKDYPFAIIVNGEEIIAVADGTDSCATSYSTTAPRYVVTVPAGTKSVTITNDQDFVLNKGEYETVAQYVTSADVEISEGTSYHFNTWNREFEAHLYFVYEEAEGGAPEESAEYVIKVNDAVMELVDGGIQSGCDSRYISDDVQLFNVTVPAGTTTVTVELKEDATATFANIQYMVDGADHAFGGNAQPAFEADIANYDGLCIKCGGKYYHVTFTVEENSGNYQSIITDMEGDVLVTEQEMIDGWVPYYHVVVPRGSEYAIFTYPANTIQANGGMVHTIEWTFGASHAPDKYWQGTTNADGSVTVSIPIADLITEEAGTGTAVCFWKASGTEVLEGFTFSYAEDTSIFLVTLAAGNGYTTDGAGYVKTGEDYSFTVDIKNGYDATNMVVKVNGEVVTPDENGVYTVYAVSEDLVITVEGVVAIPTDGDVTFYFSVEEGAKFVEQGGVIWALEEVTVPYFDLAQYDMEYLYYNPDCYKEGQASQAPGTKEQAEGVVTLLHALIWLTEVYYNELDPADTGKGWLNENGWPGFNVYSATAGSAFFYMWDFGTNFNYYINYEYPLGYPGWGATCDQIKLSDGDVVSMRYNDNSGNVGTYHHFGKKAIVTKTVNAGQSFDLDIYRTGEDYANYTTPVYLVGEGHNVYLFAEDEIDVNPASGTLMATTDAGGKVTIDTTGLELGTYYLVSNSMSPAIMLLTVEGGDHIHQYDAVVTDPTCTEQGYTTYTCACGDSYVSDYTEPTGHNFVDGECANGCGTTATVIPESALFTDITCNAEGTITVTEHEDPSGMGLGYYHVELPVGATTAYVTFPADSIYIYGGQAWVRAIPIPDFSYTTDHPSNMTTNEDGSVTVPLTISDFYAEEPGNGMAALFGEPDTMDAKLLMTFCNTEEEGGEEPDPDDPEVSENKVFITLDLTAYDGALAEDGYFYAYGPETDVWIDMPFAAGEIYETSFNAAIIEQAELAIGYDNSIIIGWEVNGVECIGTTELVYKEYEVAEDVKVCFYTPNYVGLFFGVDSADYAGSGEFTMKPIFAPEPSYKSEYGITVLVGGEEMDLVANGTEPCGTMEATKLNVTVPAGTTEVTFLNITDEVLWSQMYVYSGAHDWTEYASNVTEATINLEECGTSFCISDSANNWYHVNIIVEEPPHEHSYDSLVTEPTCTEGGYTTYTCECGDSYVADETPALGHSYDCHVTAPSCTEEGVKTYTCASCGDTYTETVPATGHTEGETVVENEVAATCTETGSYDNVVRCSVCGEELSRETVTVDALGHDVILVESEPASCEMNGYEYHACSRCGGQEYTIILEATGHSYTDGTCEHCGAADPDANKPSMPGFGGWFDKWFGHWWGDQEEEKCEHTYSSVVTDPTCTKKGYTTHTCTKCGDSYKDNYVAATGHHYENNICTECGHKNNKKPVWNWFWPFW